MDMKTKNHLILAFFLLSNVAPLNGNAQTTAFNYQGKLNDGATPANGVYDLQFAIYDSVTNGNQIASALTNAATGVSNGLFSVTLDFGGIFTGTNYWLDISVRTNGGPDFFTLAPRQPILPVPYAVYSANAGLATTAIYASAA